ncbi:MAG: hypothetical protein DHS20C15_11620 [Planctomycetota bacterium]|nr:MAG: hypothetical protein DHS20C15_11620 [Planctomycetota bacterium]
MLSRTLRLLLIVSAANLLLGALLVDPSDTTWVLSNVTSKASAKAKGIGSVKVGGPLSGDIEIHGDFSFDADLDGTAISGTWTRKSAKAKRLDLTLDAMSIEALEQRYESDLALFAPIPISTDLTLNVEKSKLRATIKPKKKAGTVRIKAKVSLRFEGLTDGNGKSDRPTKVKATIKGFSDTQSLAPLLLLD